MPAPQKLDESQLQSALTSLPSWSLAQGNRHRKDEPSPRVVQRLEQSGRGSHYARRRRHQRQRRRIGQAPRRLRREDAMTSRREFLGAAALSASRVLGANDRINVGIIGVGGMGFGHVRMLKPRTDIRITSISDIYTKHKHRAKDFLGLTDRDIHHDYKDLLARSDVDAVFVVTPDHWHYGMAMDALDVGKDVYVQKPMAYR